jgi:hypothetical protein
LNTSKHKSGAWLNHTNVIRYVCCYFHFFCVIKFLYRCENWKWWEKKMLDGWVVRLNWYESACLRMVWEEEEGKCILSTLVYEGYSYLYLCLCIIKKSPKLSTYHSTQNSLFIDWRNLYLINISGDFTRIAIYIPLMMCIEYEYSNLWESLLSHACAINFLTPWTYSYLPSHRDRTRKKMQKCPISSSFFLSFSPKLNIHNCPTFPIRFYFFFFVRHVSLLCCAEWINEWMDGKESFHFSKSLLQFSPLSHLFKANDG